MLHAPLETSLRPPETAAGARQFRRETCVFDFAKPSLRFFAQVAAEQAGTRYREREGYLLIFAERARCEGRLNGRSLTLPPGDLLVVKPGDCYEMQRACGPYLTLGVDLISEGTRLERDVIFGAETTADQQVVRRHGATFRLLLERMRDEAEKRDPFVGHVQNALLLELLWETVRLLPTESLSSSFFLRRGERSFRQQLAQRFEANCGQSISIPRLAAEMGVSVRTLTKRCRELLGRPPRQAFEHFKMGLAATTLRNSDKPIKNISLDLGFQNQYHFSRRFSSLMGMAPSHYRAAIKEGVLPGVARLPDGIMESQRTSEAVA